METKIDVKRILFEVPLSALALGIALLFSTCADPMRTDFTVPEPKPMILDPAIKQFSINGNDGRDFIGSGMITYPSVQMPDGQIINDGDKKDVDHIPSYGLSGKITATVSYDEIKYIWANTTLDSNISRGTDGNRHKRITFVPRFETDSKLIMDYRLYSSGNKVGDIHQALRAIMPESTGNNPGLVHGLITGNPSGAVRLIQGEFRKKKFDFDKQIYLAQKPPDSRYETALAGDSGNYMSIDIGTKVTTDPDYDSRFDPSKNPFVIDENEPAGVYSFVIYSVSREGYVAMYDFILTVQTIASTKIVSEGSTAPSFGTARDRASDIDELETAADYWVQKDFSDDTRTFKTPFINIIGPVNVIGGFEGSEQSASQRRVIPAGPMDPTHTTLNFASNVNIDSDTLFLQDITINTGSNNIVVKDGGTLTLKNTIIKGNIEVQSGGMLVIQDSQMSPNAGQSKIEGNVTSSGNVTLTHGTIVGNVVLNGGEMTIHEDPPTSVPPIPVNEIKPGTATGTGVIVGAGAKLTMKGGKISGYKGGANGTGVEVVGTNPSSYGIFSMEGGEISDNIVGVRVGKSAMFNKKTEGIILGLPTAIIDATLEGKPGLMGASEMFATDIPIIGAVSGGGYALEWKTTFGSGGSGVGRFFNGFSQANPPPQNSAILGSAPTKQAMRAVPIMLGSASLISSSTIGSGQLGSYFIFYGNDKPRFEGADNGSTSVFTNSSGLNDRVVLYFNSGSGPGDSAGTQNVVIARGAKLSYASGVTPTVNTLEGVGGNGNTGININPQTASHDALEITLSSGEFAEQDELNKYQAPNFGGTGLSHYLFSIDPQVAGSGVDHFLRGGKIIRDNGTKVTITELSPLATQLTGQKIIVNAAAIRGPLLATATFGTSKTTTTAGELVRLTSSSWGVAGSQRVLDVISGGTYIIKENNVWRPVASSGSVSTSGNINLGAAIVNSVGLSGTTITGLINGNTYDVYRIYDYGTGTEITLNRDFGNSIVMLSNLMSGDYKFKSTASTRDADVKLLLYTGGTSGIGSYSIPNDTNGTTQFPTLLTAGSYYKVGNQYWAYKLSSGAVTAGAPAQPKLAFNATDNYSTLSSLNQVSNELNLIISRGLLLAQGGYGTAMIGTSGEAYIGSLSSGSYVVKIRQPSGSVNWSGIHNGMLVSGVGPIGGAFEPTGAMNQSTTSAGTIGNFPSSSTSYYSAYQFMEYSAGTNNDGTLNIGSNSGNVLGQAVYLSGLNPGQPYTATKTGTSGIIIQTTSATPNLPTEVVIATGLMVSPSSGAGTLGGNSDGTREYQEIGTIATSGLVFNDTTGNYSGNIQFSYLGSNKYFTISLPANTTSFKTSVVPAPEDVSAGLTPSNGNGSSATAGVLGSLVIRNSAGSITGLNTSWIQGIDNRATVTIGKPNFKLKNIPPTPAGSFKISNGQEASSATEPATPLNGGSGSWIDSSGSKILVLHSGTYAITGGGTPYYFYGTVTSGTWINIGSRPDVGSTSNGLNPYLNNGAEMGSLRNPGTPKMPSFIPASALKRKTVSTGASITLGH